MSSRVMRELSKKFASQTVLLCRKMAAERREYVLINQILSSGTSIGANIHEAQYAQGTRDFVSKLEIALKECHETEYWLDLLYDTNTISESDYGAMKNDCGALRRMLISSITTTKTRNNL